MSYSWQGNLLGSPFGTTHNQWSSTPASRPGGIPGSSVNDQSIYELNKKAAEAEIQKNLMKAQNKHEMALTDREAENAYKLAQLTGNYQLLAALIQGGGISPEQRQMALSRYSDVEAGLQQAMGTAQGLSQTGGFTDQQFNDQLGAYGDIKNRWQSIADRGALTPQEYQQILTSGRQDLVRQGQNAAQSTFNASNVTASPFAASAIQAQNAASTGAALAAIRAGLDQYQSDSRMQGISGMSGAIDSQTGLYNDRTSNQLAGLGAVGSLAGQQTNVANQKAGIDVMADNSWAQGMMQDMYGNLSGSIFGGDSSQASGGGNKNKARSIGGGAVQGGSSSTGTSNLQQANANQNAGLTRRIV